MKVLDLPPVWLLALLGLTYGLAQALPGGGFGLAGLHAVGAGLAALGVGVMALAVWEFLRARTTIIPGQTPSAFLQCGIYRWTRNPIYLGDAMVLAGGILWWDAPLAAPFIPLFIWLIEKRFIRQEEAVLRARFGDAYDLWAGKVRRWM